MHESHFILLLFMDILVSPFMALPVSTPPHPLTVELTGNLASFYVAINPPVEALIRITADVMKS